MFVWKRVKDDDILTVQPRDTGKREVPVLKIDGATGVATFLKTMLEPNSLGIVRTTVGVEAANGIDIACRIVDANGKALKKVRSVRIATLAVTDAQGTLGAATSAVGTIKKTPTITVGEKLQWMESNANGLFSFKVTDTAAEECLVTIDVEGCRTTLLKIVFA